MSSGDAEMGTYLGCGVVVQNIDFSPSMQESCDSDKSSAEISWTKALEAERTCVDCGTTDIDIS